MDWNKNKVINRNIFLFVKKSRNLLDEFLYFLIFMFYYNDLLTDKNYKLYGH